MKPETMTPLSEEELKRLEELNEFAVWSRLSKEGQKRLSLLLRSLLAEVRELREAQRWIPVSEKLPEHFKNVLTWHPDFGEEIVVAYYSHDQGYWNEWNDGMPGGNISNPTHWKPLPLPKLP